MEINIFFLKSTIKTALAYLAKAVSILVFHTS
jgi:hypothetical protein